MRGGCPHPTNHPENETSKQRWARDGCSMRYRGSWRTRRREGAEDAVKNPSPRFLSSLHPMGLFGYPQRLSRGIGCCTNKQVMIEMDEARTESVCMYGDVSVVSANTAYKIHFFLDLLRTGSRSLHQLFTPLSRPPSLCSPTIPSTFQHHPILFGIPTRHTDPLHKHEYYIKRAPSKTPCSKHTLIFSTDRRCVISLSALEDQSIPAKNIPGRNPPSDTA